MSKVDHMETLTVPAELSSLPVIGQYVSRVAQAAGLDKRAAYRLRLAVDEIATNIMVHGFGGSGDPTQQIELRADLDEDVLTLQIADRGPAFDPRDAPTPDPAEFSAPLEERDIGGLGIYLTFHGVDEFRYQRAGDVNQNIFVMRRNTAPALGQSEGDR